MVFRVNSIHLPPSYIAHKMSNWVEIPLPGLGRNESKEKAASEENRFLDQLNLLRMGENVPNWKGMRPVYMMEGPVFWDVTSHGLDFYLHLKPFPEMRMVADHLTQKQKVTVC